MDLNELYKEIEKAEVDLNAKRLKYIKEALFIEKYGKVMGEHYYNKFVHEFNGNILKMIGYFRGSEKEGQIFCDMITERIEKYEKRMSYDKGKLNN